MNGRMSAADGRSRPDNGAPAGELVRDVLSEVLDEDPAQLADARQLTECERWDSATSLEVLIALERRCGARFDLREFHGAGTVGGLTELVGRLAPR